MCFLPSWNFDKIQKYTRNGLQVERRLSERQSTSGDYLGVKGIGGLPPLLDIL